MPVNGRIRPNFILFISGKVSSQWLELQRNEKPFCFSHSPPGGFLGKTAHLVQFLLFPFPFLGSTDDSTTRTFHVAFDGFRLFHSPVALLRFQMCFWLFPLGEPRPEWAGQVQVSREKDVPHLGGSTRSPTSPCARGWAQGQSCSTHWTVTVRGGSRTSALQGVSFRVSQMHIPGWCCS